MYTYLPYLRKMRYQKKLSQPELAKKAGIRVRSISQYEGGSTDCRYPKIEALYSLCKALDCKIADLDPEHPLAQHQDPTYVSETNGVYSYAYQDLPEVLKQIYDNWSLLSDTHKNMLEMIVEELRKKKDEHDCEQAESA